MRAEQPAMKQLAHHESRDRSAAPVSTVMPGSGTSLSAAMSPNGATIRVSALVSLWPSYRARRAISTANASSVFDMRLSAPMLLGFPADRQRKSASADR